MLWLLTGRLCLLLHTSRLLMLLLMLNLVLPLSTGCRCSPRCLACNCFADAATIPVAAADSVPYAYYIDTIAPPFAYSETASAVGLYDSGAVSFDSDIYCSVAAVASCTSSVLVASAVAVQLPYRNRSMFAKPKSEHKYTHQSQQGLKHNMRRFLVTTQHLALYQLLLDLVSWTFLRSGFSHSL
ncbi:hypothetical protein BX667DRAFT_510358 [Coemansia mojavensis]|nr:hypothetical protein BX667DRAFT_510358 [Coemansia mojavensis]